MSKYLTVIYKFSHKEAFDEEWKRIHPLFLAGDDASVGIVAVSTNDAITMLEKIEGVINDEESDVHDMKDQIEAILSCSNIHDMIENRDDQ
jgi:hypothetical protein